MDNSLAIKVIIKESARCVLLVSCVTPVDNLQL